MKDRDKIIEVLNKYGEKDKPFGGNYIKYSDYEAIADEILNLKSQEKEIEQGEQLKSADFVQYVTNLLYNAYNDGKQQISKDLFDEWIEKEMENMSEFYASQSNDYPEEFVEWCMIEVIYDGREDLGYMCSIYLNEECSYKVFKDIPELYNYWITNIKHK